MAGALCKPAITRKHVLIHSSGPPDELGAELDQRAAVFRPSEFQQVLMKQSSMESGKEKIAQSR